MDQEQGGVPPKGKVDILEAVDAAARQPGFNPIDFAQRLGKDMRRGAFDVELNVEAFRQRRVDDPEYKEGTSGLQDLETISKSIIQAAQDDRFVNGYRPQTQFGSNPNVAPPPVINSSRNPYQNFGADGSMGWAGGNKQELAVYLGDYIDSQGALRKLLASDLKHKNLEVLEMPETDEDGRMMYRPVLRELKENESSFGREMLAADGLLYQAAKPFSRTWLGSFSAGLYNTVGTLGSLAVAPVTQAREGRLRTMYQSWERLGVGPETAQGFEDAIDRGLMMPLPKELQAAHPGFDQRMHEQLDLLESNRSELGKLAQMGDESAKLALDMLDLRDGLQNKGSFQRFLEAAAMIQARTSIPTSYRRDEQGLFGGGEAISSLLGEALGYIGPQAGAARTIGSAVMQTGMKSLVSRSVASGMGSVLTRGGGRVVAGTSMMVPTVQMLPLVYKGAREAGYGHDDATNIMWLSAPMIALTEATLSTPYLMRGMVQKGSRQGIIDGVAKSLLRPEAKQATKQGLAVRAWNGMLRGFGNSGADNAFVGFGKNVVEGFWREGTQEMLEEGGYAIVEEAYDRYSGKDLYEKSRGPQYSLWNRLGSSFAAGGVMGAFTSALIGGRRPVKPYDKGIAAMVANGMGQDLRKAVARMRKDGRITEQEEAVLNQDIALADDVMNGMNVSDPEVVNEILKERDMTTEFAETSMRIKELEAALQQEGIAEGDKASMTKELGQAKAKVQSILGGDEIVRRYKDRQSLIQGFEQKQGGLRAADADAIAAEFRQYSTYRKERHEQARLVRSENVEALDAALKKLTSSSPGSYADAAEELAKVLLPMRDAGAITEEDKARIAQALKAVDVAMIDEIWKTPVPESMKQRGAEWGELMDDMTQAGFSSREEAMDEWGTEFGIVPDSDAAKKLYNEREAMKGFGKAMAGMRAEITDASIDQELKPESLFADYMSSVSLKGGGYVDLRDYVGGLANRTEATAEELKELETVIGLLESREQTRQRFAGPYRQTASKFKASNSASLVPESAPARKQLAADNEEVYTPAASVAGERLTAHADLIAKAKAEQIRLGGLLDARRGRYERMHVADLGIQLKLVELFSGWDPKTASSEEFIAALSEATKLLEADDRLAAEKHVIRLRKIISDAIRASASKPAELLRHILNSFDWQTEMDLSYRESLRVNQQSFDSYFDPSLLADRAIPQFAANAMTTYFTNWVSELARIDPAKAYVEMEKLLGIQSPTVEQERRIIEAAAFLANPDQDLTESLLGAKRKPTKEDMESAVPRLFTLPGRPGVGKTTIAPLIVALASKLVGRPMKITVIAPGAQNLNDLSSAVATMNPGGTVSVVPMSRLASIEQEHDADVFILDEGHLADRATVDAVRELMRSHPKASMLVLGDPMQAPSIHDQHEVFPLERTGMRALPLQVSLRQQNIPMMQVLEELHKQVFGNMQADIVIPSLPLMRYDPLTGKGVRFVPSGDPQEVINLFSEWMKRKGVDPSTKDAILIVADESQRKAVINELSKDFDLLAALDKKAIGSLVKTMDKGEASALGTERDMVFVAFNDLGLGGSYSRFLYTAISRGKHGVVAALKGGRSEPSRDIQDASSERTVSNLFKENRERVKSIAADMAPRVSISEDVVTSKPSDEVPSPEPKKPSKKGSKSSKKKPKKTTQSELPFTENDPDRIPSWPAEPVESLPGAGRLARLYTEQSPGLAGSTLGFRFNPKFPGTNKVIDSANPDYAQRMQVLKAIQESGMAFTVSYRKVSEGDYSSTANEQPFKAPMIEVHLDAGPRGEGLVMLNRIRKSLNLPLLKSHEEAVADGATMLGFMYRNTKYKDTLMAERMAKLWTDFASDQWPEGGFIPAYSGLRMLNFYSGIGAEPLNVERPADAKQFIEDIRKKSFQTEGPYLVSATASDPAYMRDGKPMPAIVLYVSPWAGGPATKVFLTGKTPDDAYYADMLLGLSHKSRQEKEGRLKSAPDPYESRAFQFLMWNRSALVQDGKPNPLLEEFLVVDEHGFARPATDGKTFQEAVSVLREAISVIRGNEDLRGRMFTFPRLAQGATSRNGHQSIDSRDLEMLQPSSATVGMPAFTVDLPMSRTASSHPSAESGMLRVTRRKEKSSPTERALKRLSLNKVDAYYRRVLGDKFVDGKLSFRPNLGISGRQLWGVMENGRIILEASEDGVRAGVERHEAVHYVLDHLLDDASRLDILHESARLYAEKHGMKWWQVTDEQANEFIAEQYEKPSYDTSTAFGRFMRWLKGVMKRWKLYSSRIDDLLYAIENGDFRNASSLRDANIIRYSEKHPSDSTDGRAGYSIGDSLPQELRDRLNVDEERSFHSYKERHVIARALGNDHVQASVVIDMIRGRIMQRSEHQAPAADFLSHPLPNLEKAYRQVLADLKHAASSFAPNYAPAEGQEPVAFSDLSDVDIRRLSDEDYQRFVTWRVSDEQMMLTVFQAAFPGIDARRFALGETAESDPVLDVDVERPSVMHNSTQYTNPFASMSGLTKAMIATTRLIVGNGMEGSAYEMQEFEDYGQTRIPLLYEVAQEAAQFIDPGNLDSFAAALKEIEDADPESERGRHAGTLYRRFLAKDGWYTSTNGKPTYSYRYLVENADTLMAMHDNSPALAQRIEMARDIVTDVMRSLMEMVGTNRSMTEQRGNQLHHRRFGWSAVASIRSDMNERLAAPFIAGSLNVGIDEEYRKQWVVGRDTDPEEGWRIDERGIVSMDDEVLVRLNADGSFTAVSQEVDLWSSFFAAARYPLSFRTIESMLFKSEGASIARIAGAWGMAIHAGIHAVESGERQTGLFSERTLSGPRIMRTGVNMDSLRDLVGEDADEGILNKSIPTPSMFIGLNQELARTEAMSSGTVGITSIRSLDGKTIYPVNLRTAYSILLPANHGGKHSSLAMEQLAPSLIARDPALAGNFPLLDSKRTERIKDIDEYIGVMAPGYEFASKPYMMDRPLTERVILDRFFSSLLSGTSNENLIVALPPNGDRETIHFATVEQLLGNERLFHIDKANRTLDLNMPALGKWMQEQFRYEVTNAKLSIARWSEFLGKPLKNASEAKAAIAAMTAQQAALALSSTTLMNERDYIRGKDGKLMAGHAMSMDSSTIYTAANAKKVLAPNADPAALVMEVYGPMLKAYADDLALMNASLPRDAVSAFSEVSQKKALAGFALLSHFLGRWTMIPVLGPVSQYKDSRDWFKRTTLATSPGKAVIPIAGGVGPTFRVAVIEEPIKGKKALDGQDYMMPWFHRQLRASTGGRNGITKDAVNKMGVFQNDFILKSSQLPVNWEVYTQNPFAQALLRRSLMFDAQVLAAWDSAIGNEATPESFDAAVDAVLQTAAQLGLSEQLIGLISSESNVKAGLRGLNAAIAESPLASVQLDTRFLRLQTNLEKDVERKENRSAPYWSQLSAIAASGPGQNHADVMELHENEAAMTTTYLKRVDEEIDSMPGDDRVEKVEQWLRYVGLKKTAMEGRLGQIPDMLLNMDSSINNPVLRPKLMEFLSNEVSRRGIYPKMHGAMFADASAYGFLTQDEIEVTTEPTEMSLKAHSSYRASAEYRQDNLLYQRAEEQWAMSQPKEIDNPRPSIDQQKEIRDSYRQELDEYMAGWDNENPAPAAIVEKKSVMRPLRAPSVQNGKYQPGEVLMPFLYAQEFGFEDDGWRQMTFHEIRNDIQSRLGDRGVLAFDKAMEVFIVRVPSSGMGSGHWMKVVGFVNGTKNTIYTPFEKNEQTGGDYDGDQLAVYSRNLFRQEIELDQKNDGKPAKKEWTVSEKADPQTVEGLQNRAMDIMRRIYDNPANAEFIMQPVGVEVFQAALEAVESADQIVDPVRLEPFTPTQHSVSRREAFDGAVLIGAGAIMMKAYSLMSGAYQESMLQGNAEDLFRNWFPKADAAGYSVMAAISQSLNAMLDNTKHMMIGRAGITMSNQALFFGMLMDGVSLDEAIKMMRHPLVVEASKSAGGGAFRNMLGTFAFDPMNDPFADARPRLVKLAEVGQLLADLGKVLSIGTKGVPHNDALMDGAFKSIETLINAPLSDFLADRDSNPAHMMLVNRFMRQRDADDLVERHKHLDMGGIVKLMPSAMAILKAVEWTENTNRTAFIERHPAVKAIKSSVLERLAMDSFTAKQQAAWSEELTSFLISLHMDQNYAGVNPSVILGSMMPKRLVTSADQYHFVMSFPAVWQNMTSRIMALPASDERKRAYLSNSFLQQVRVVSDHALKLEVRDGQALMRDERQAERMRRDAELMDLAFVGDGLMGDYSMSEMVGVYSLLKDRLQFGRNSLTRFLPASWMNRLDFTFDSFHKKLENPETSIYSLSSGESVSAKVLLERLAEAFPIVRADVTKSAGEQSDLMTKRVQFGNKSMLQVFERNPNGKAGDKLSLPFSMLAPRISVHGNDVLRNATVWSDLDYVTYLKVMNGLKLVELVLSSPLGVNAGDSIHLPTGHALPVTQTLDEGRTIWLDARQITLPESHDDEHPGLNKLVFDEESLPIGGKPAFGKNHRELDGLDGTTALKQMAERSQHPIYREMLQFLSGQQGIAQRAFRVRVSNLRKIHGRATPYMLELSQSLSPLALEMVFIHEAVHRLTSHALNAPNGELSDDAKRFKATAKALYDEFLSVATDEMVRKYGSDVHEFVAESMSNIEMQQAVREAVDAKGLSIWQKLINAIRRLFGMPVLRNDIVARAIDATRLFIERSSKQGETYNDPKWVKYMASHLKMSESSSHGVYGKRREVKDIRDLTPRLMGRKGEARGFEEMDVDREVNRIIENEIDFSRTYQTVGGTTIHLQGKTRDEVRRILREDVVPAMKLYYDRRKDAMPAIFNSKDWKKAWSERWSDPKRRSSMDSESAMAFVARQIDHQEGDIYLMHSWLLDKERVIDGTDKKVKDLGINAVEGFSGYDPVIKVRSTMGRLNVTMVDIVRNPLDMQKEYGVGKKLLSNYVNGFMDRANKGLVMPNSESGMRRFLMGLSAMALKQANPGMALRNAKVLNMSMDSQQSDVLWMHDFLHDLKVMRGTALANELPPRIKAVVDDESLHDASEYDQSWLPVYLEWLQNHPSSDSDFKEIRLSYSNVMTELERINTAENGLYTKSSMLEALRYRMDMINKTRENPDTDPEVPLISQAIAELMQQKTMNRGVTHRMDMLSKLFRNAQDIRHPHLQMLIRTIENSSNNIASEMNAFRKSLHAEAAKLDGLVPSGLRVGGLDLVDNGWKRFERILKYSAESDSDVAPRVYDEDGNLVKVNLNAVHWNEKDPHTAAELAAGRITKAEVAFGAWIAEQAQEMMRDSMLHQLRMNGVEHRDASGAFDELAAKANAASIVNKRYPKGWIPVVRSPFSEKLTQGNLRNALQTLWTSHMNIDNLFNEDVGRYDDSTGIGNRYLSEVEENSSGTPIGNETRLRRMGLRLDGATGKVVAADVGTNLGMTKNIESIMILAKLASVRQRIHEQKSLPVYNATISLFNMIEAVDKRDVTQEKDWARMYADRMLFLGGAALKDDQPMLMNIAPASNLLISYTSFVGVSLSWKVAMQSGILNEIGMLATAIASDIADDGLFGKKELIKAHVMMGDKANRDKMAALLHHHFVTESSEQEVGVNFRKSKTRRLLFSSHTMNVMNWWTDHMARGIVMTAQMLKDGSWDAYSLTDDGEVVYDERKDGQWYENGKLKPDADIIMADLKQALIDDGHVGQEADKPLKAGYDFRSGRRFKWIADKMVIGGMDRTQQPMLNNVWYGRMFSTFSNFLYTKIANWYLPPTSVEAGGKRVVVTDRFTGKKVAKWELYEMTGYVHALNSAILVLANKAGMGWSETKSLTKAEKRAISRLAYDVAMFAVLYGLYAMMVPDEEERKKMRRAVKLSDRTETMFEKRFHTMFLNMAMDSFAASPYHLAERLVGQGASVVPAATTAINLVKMIGDPSKFIEFVPGKSPIKDFADLWERETQQ